MKRNREAPEGGPHGLPAAPASVDGNLPERLLLLELSEALLVGGASAQQHFSQSGSCCLVTRRKGSEMREARRPLNPSCRSRFF